MAWLASSLRRLRDDRMAALGLIALVLVTAFVFSAAPRLLAREADDALRAEVEATSAATRNVQIIQERRIGPGSTDPMSAVDAAGADLERQVPPAVRGLFVERIFRADTPRWRVVTQTKTASLLTLRVEQGVGDRLTYVEGRAPKGQPVVVPATPGSPTAVGSDLAYEVAVSSDTADEVGIRVGDTLQLALDQTDSLARGHNDRTAVRISGIFTVDDPAAPYWSDDTSLDRPTQHAVSADVIYTNAVAVLAPDAYPRLMSSTDRSGMPLRYSWRFLVDPGRLEAGRVDDLLVDLRRMESVFPASPVVVGAAARSTILRSGLLTFIEGQQARWQSAQVVLTAVAIGPATVAGAALGLVILLGSGRRRAALALARSRGASPGQVITATATEGLLLAIPPAIVALVVATVAIPIGLDPPTVAIPLVVAAVAVILVVGSVLGTPGVIGRREREGRRASPRRLMIEGLVVVLAIAGALLLRDRGVRGASSTADLSAADPFIAAVPALAGLAAGLVALRLFPFPVRFLAALAALRRDLVPVLALRRTSRGSNARPILLVVLATASVGAFSLATLAFLDRAGEAVAWQEVGAPFRLVVGDSRLGPGFDPTALPGVSSAAGAFAGSVGDGGPGAPQVLAVDLADYRTVVAGTPADRIWPQALLAPPADAVPAIVSPTGVVVDGIKVGDRFQLPIAGSTVTFVAAEVDDTFPTLPVGGPFIVADRGALTAASRSALRTTTIFLAAPDAASDRLVSTMATEAPGVAVLDQAARAAPIRTAPVVIAVSLGVLAAMGCAIAYALLALLATLALSGAARATEAAHLRTLGLGRRATFWLTIVEHGPTVLLAIGFGIGFGLATFVALRPGLGLAAIVGSPLDFPLDLGRIGRAAHPGDPGGRRTGDRTGRCDPARTGGGRRPATRDGMTRTRYGEGAQIVCDNLVRIFKVADLEVVALQGLDLLVGAGEMMAIVGASGSGKSTLLNILGGLDAPSAGRAEVAGHDLAQMGRRERTAYRRRVVGVVWQQTGRNLLPYLSARENVELPMILDGRARRRTRALELLDLVGLADRADHRPERLSGGEQQRVAIAVALANRPAVVLADEPTGELDSATSAEVFALLRRVNAELGTTIVVVTHDPLVSEQVARTVRIRDGRTTTETRRRTERGDDGDHRVIAEEFALLDRVGRLQLPRAHIEALELAERVRLRLENDHVGVFPDRAQDARRSADEPGQPRPAAGPMVEAIGVDRSFPSGAGVVHALRGVDLGVGRGELVAIRGRSGSGKTTLLNVLGGLDRPTAGRVAIDGVEVSALSEADLVELRRRSVAYIFQAFGLVPILSAAENVEVPLRLVRAEPNERDRRVYDLLDLVGLGERARHRPHELSGGEQQRVAIARALANRPKLLLADEPTGQLDSETGHTIMTLLRSVVRSEGVTAIVATHDPAMLDVADRIVDLRDGRLTQAAAQLGRAAAGRARLPSPGWLPRSP